MLMYNKGHPIRQHHENTYGNLDTFGYKDFIPLFTGENFDAVEWASLIKQSGAEFAGPVSLHADGFAMWDSDITRWNAKDMGPKRDVVGEMANALRSKGLKFIATFHHQWKYAWYPTWDKNTDAANPDYADLYGPVVPKGTFVLADKPTAPLPNEAFNQQWLDKVIEVVDKYNPDLVYFDNKMDIIQEQKRLDFLSYYYNHAQSRKQDVVVTYKFEDLKKGSAVLDLERARMSELMPFPWLTDDSIDWGSWSHTNKPNYKSTNRMIDFLVDVVSKNGRVLLNIPPTASGDIPSEVRTRLKEIGEWFDINGEAIYGTRPWKIYGQGPTKVIEGHLSEQQNAEKTQEDIRFTQKNNSIYAFIMDWPTAAIQITKIKGNNENVARISLVGSEEKIIWNWENGSLRIKAPVEKIGHSAFAFKIELK